MSPRPIDPTIRGAGESGPARTPDAERLREALSHWASGVTLVAVSDGEEVAGLTVSAFSPLSLEPPLVLVCLDERASILPMLLDVGRFTVNLLAEDQRREAALFAGSLPNAASPLLPHGDPLLPGSLVSLVCSLWRTHEGGDHRIVVGAVERVEIAPDSPPLLYHRRGYRGLRQAR